VSGHAERQRSLGATGGQHTAFIPVLFRLRHRRAQKIGWQKSTQLVADSRIIQVSHGRRSTTSVREE
jgi:hypothetical protein